MFSWTPFYKEMAQWVLQYRNRQKVLIDTLKKIGVESNLTDEDKKGNKPLEVIDPFTFFAFFQKIKVAEKRAVLLEKFKKEVGLKSEMPGGYAGQPSAQPMALRYFPKERDRKGYELDLLWDLAEQAVKGNLEEKTFSKVLALPGIQIAKLTQGLFWLNPENFYPIDSHKKYLVSNGIEVEVKNLNDYLKIVELVKKTFNKPLYVISDDAWRWTNDSNKVNYWIFQCNPDLFNITEALEQNLVEDWTVTAHKEEIKTGDKVIIWVTGKKQGCYALAEITKEPRKIAKSKDDHLWKSENKNSLVVDIRITYNLVKNPILYENIASHKSLSNLNNFKRGTNFTSNKEQYESILKIINMNTKKAPLNQILFGPPGTGKTYSAIPYALNIINNFQLKDSYSKAEWEVLKSDFDTLKKSGQIEFVTFHQSMSYEDFVEGIKPKMADSEIEVDEENETLKYEINEGVFKKIAANAAASQTISQESDNYLLPKEVLSKMDSISYGKIRLENWGVGNEVYDYCINNDCVSIPFDVSLDFTNNKNEQETEKALSNKKYGRHLKVAVKTIRHWLKKDDIIFITSTGKNFVKSVAQVIGDYYYNPDAPIAPSQFRKVKWLLKDVNIPINKIYALQFSPFAACMLYNKNVLKDFFKNPNSKGEQNYVLIIDEINRGNIAAIFGELITLLEPAKRIGGNEHLKITLPYSKTSFDVPSNLYIIGTMNTADRSVEALDAALRRRFCFLEMSPNYNLEELKYEIAGFQVHQILKTINSRIEKLLDKDHAIGHSYLMLNNGETPIEKISEAFYKNIIPLLQEYFYGDYGKLGLVLGKGFIVRKEWNKNSDSFAEFDHESSSEFDERDVYEVIDYRNNNHNFTIEIKDKEGTRKIEMDFEKAIKLLMKVKIEQL